MNVRLEQIEVAAFPKLSNLSGFQKLQDFYVYQSSARRSALSSSGGNLGFGELYNLLVPEVQKLSAKTFRCRSHVPCSRVSVEFWMAGSGSATLLLFPLPLVAVPSTPLVSRFPS